VSPKRETSLPLPVRFLAAWIGVWLGRSQQQLIEYQREEIQLLRQKLGGRRLRFSDGDRRRLAVLGRKLGRRALGQVATVATPDTILRWYRELVAKKYDGSAKRGPGRPGTVTGVIRLLVRMARENPSWGYTRLRGALKNIGHELGRNTIRVSSKSRVSILSRRGSGATLGRRSSAPISAPSLRRISSLSR
jgi:hypothetical protein